MKNIRQDAEFEVLTAATMKGVISGMWWHIICQKFCQTIWHDITEGSNY
jgi:hypothetical protein